ncbi:MAG: hypothetical protein IKR18_02820 [Bacteroidaceae bacterium]|nr:hypothetical protein [Bacteroidaceae bacterium]
MPKLGTTIVLLFSFSNVFSQNLLTKSDVGLETGSYPCKAIEYFNPGKGGSGCVWDFTGLNLSGKSFDVIQRIDSTGMFTVVNDRRIVFYEEKDDCLLELGYETPLKKTYYYKPVYGMKYPLVLGDSVSKAFGGYGVYCNDHYYYETGFCSVTVDGQGDIVLSDADTLKNAVRVYKLRSYSTAMDMEFQKLDSAGTKQVVEERYEWYVEGQSKPVLETVTSTSYSDLTPLGTSRYAYCCIPENVMCNLEERMTEKHDEPQAEDIIHYSVNVGNGRVTVDYSLDEDANITMLLSSQTGMVYRNRRFTQKAGEGYSADFDVSGLRRDVYVLYINVNGKIYNEKIKL